MLKIDKKEEKQAFQKLIDARADLSFAHFLLLQANSDEETRVKILYLQARIREIQGMLDDMLLDGHFKEMYEKFEKEES